MVSSSNAPKSGVSTIIIPKTDVENFIDRVNAARPLIEKEFKFFHNAVIVAKFIRTKIGSVWTPTDTQTEDKWQGKTGLVVTLGPIAFVDEPNFNFHGLSVKAGEWALYRHTDGWDFDFTLPGTTDKLHLRLLEDTQIKGSTMRPELVW